MTIKHPGFADDHTQSHVVFGTVVEVPFPKSQSIAEAVYVDGDIRWAAFPDGDASSTTGYSESDTIQMAIGVVLRSAGRGFSQGSPGFPQAITSDLLSAAKLAWNDGLAALNDKLAAHELKLDTAETLLVATGPLSQAVLEMGADTKYCEGISRISIDGDATLTCIYD